ncbi:MAG: Peptidyl-tRNA hydrolase [Mycoplasmataceae bacterium]|nr:MAG: Peptidyl-tRNA hydrolase [Mycoplasmataceae bacterium]
MNGSVKLIVGLGNPGQEYENTRHNLGFVVIDKLVDKLEIDLNKKKFNGFYYQANGYILLKPQTYMNNSGECIKDFLKYFSIPIDNLLVIYDDIALPLGNFRYRLAGSAGGHNGMRNIIELLKTQDFKRLRLGIGYDNNFLIKDWVLKNFSSLEKEEIKKNTPMLVESLIEWIRGNNFEKIMSKLNSNKNS